jgi:hypothetical protein
MSADAERLVGTRIVRLYLRNDVAGQAAEPAEVLQRTMSNFIGPAEKMR